MKTYRVGGAIRDRLLGFPSQDSDWVVVGAQPEEMSAKGFKQVGKDFPVFLHPQTHEEYALARTERKTAPGYKGFETHSSPQVSLEEDLIRRDLTINAMAEAEDGTIIDPYGGLADIKNKILRHVSPAFNEDPVRILRVARFTARLASLNFQVAGETNALMKSMVESGEIDTLVPERVWREMERALGENQPRKFFETLRDCGALARLLPELDQLFGIPQRPEYHPEIDTGLHTMMVLDQATRLTKNSCIRFAAVMHDLGKGTTPKQLLPRHHGHEQRGIELVRKLCQRLRIPNEYRDLALNVTRFHGHCHRAKELNAKTLLKTLGELDAFRRPKRFEQFLVACKADALGRKGAENNPYPQADVFRNALHAATSVNSKALIEQGYEGVKFGEELHRQRLRAISAISD